MDAEDLSLQEDLKALKEGVENFKFLHPEVLVSVFQIKRSVKLRAFSKIARCIIDKAHLIKE